VKIPKKHVSLSMEQITDIADLCRDKLLKEIKDREGVGDGGVFKKLHFGDFEALKQRVSRMEPEDSTFGNMFDGGKKRYPTKGSAAEAYNKRLLAVEGVVTEADDKYDNLVQDLIKLDGIVSKLGGIIEEMSQDPSIMLRRYIDNFTLGDKEEEPARWEKCYYCNGTKTEDRTHYEPFKYEEIACTVCNGKGLTPVYKERVLRDITPTKDK